MRLFLSAGKMRNVHGWTPDRKDHRDFTLDDPLAIIPAVADLRPQCTAVRDQEAIGSCHDAETEVLTERGWSKFADVTDSDLLATVDPTTSRLAYEKPVRLVRYPYVGPMVRGKNMFMDFLVTPDHKMLVRKWDQAMTTLRSEYDFVNAGDLGWYAGLLNNIEWAGTGSDTYTIPGVADHKHIPQRSPRSVPMAAWLRFLGIFIADGTLIQASKSSARAIYKIQLAATKEDKRTFFRETLAAIGVVAGENEPYKDRLVFHSRQIFEELTRLGFLGTHAPQKRVPDFVFSQSSAMIKEFLFGHFMGDGAESNNQLRAHYTSSAQLAEDIQRLIFLSGAESHISVREARSSMMADGRQVIGRYPEHRVSVCERRQSSIDRKRDISQEQYAGEVFCAEVPSYHTLVTRRNGHVLISGNCAANAALEACGHLYTKAGNPDPVLSRLFAYAKCRQAESIPLSEDSGCSIRVMLKVLASVGAPPESEWPYVESEFSVSPPDSLLPVAALHKIMFFYRCTTLFTIKASIAQGFPVIFGVSVPRNMMSPECAQTGVVKYPAADEDFVGGHAILAVGYNDSTSLVMFQNSWSTAWGDGGFGYLPYRMFVEGFCTSCWTIRRELQ